MGSGDMDQSFGVCPGVKKLKEDSQEDQLQDAFEINIQRQAKKLQRGGTERIIMIRCNEKSEKCHRNQKDGSCGCYTSNFSELRATA